MGAEHTACDGNVAVQDPCSTGIAPYMEGFCIITVYKVVDSALALAVQPDEASTEHTTCDGNAGSQRGALWQHAWPQRLWRLHGGAEAQE